MKKTDFILECADFSHDEEGWHCENSSLIGTFAGRSFLAKTKEEASKQMVSYFDREMAFDGKTFVKEALIKIGWNEHLDEINVNKEYLKDNLISKIIYEEFKGFNFVSNDDAIIYSFKEELRGYSDSWLIKKCKDVFNINVESYDDAITKIETNLFNTENWDLLGKDNQDLKSHFKNYYNENFEKEGLQEIYNSINK